MKLSLIILFSSLIVFAGAVKLEVHQDGFYYNGAKVFLSGSLFIKVAFTLGQKTPRKMVVFFNEKNIFY